MYNHLRQRHCKNVIFLCQGFTEDVPVCDICDGAIVCHRSALNAASSSASDTSDTENATPFSCVRFASVLCAAVFAGDLCEPANVRPTQSQRATSSRLFCFCLFSKCTQFLRDFF